mmetsp:Transcript_33522/g.60096  ORF Transcript_33522/g.60096 Transcript_33522/m.60096 type:complete len:111 (-) Transcript_33522:456-788(-)
MFIYFLDNGLAFVSLKVWVTLCRNQLYHRNDCHERILIAHWPNIPIKIISTAPYPCAKGHYCNFHALQGSRTAMNVLLETDTTLQQLPTYVCPQTASLVEEGVAVAAVLH